MDSSLASPESYCLLYQGPRWKEFYQKFSEFGLAPGLNSRSYA